VTELYVRVSTNRAGSVVSAIIDLEQCSCLFRLKSKLRHFLLQVIENSLAYFMA
jgi:hypothetical protein